MQPTKKTVQLALRTAINATAPKNKSVDPEEWQKEQNKLIDKLRALYDKL